MALKDTIKETKAKLEEVLEQEKEVETKALEALDKTVKEAVEEPKKEEIIKEEPKKDEVKEESKKTDAEYAQERIAKKKEKDRVADELVAAKERIAALEALAKPEAKKPLTDPEPDASTKPLEWTAWKIRNLEKDNAEVKAWKAEQEKVSKQESLKSQAQREVETFEQQLRPKYDDYDDVKNFYARMLASSIKIVNPKITNNQLAEAVNNRLLTRASELLSDGYENPIEAMYLEAKSLGYQPKQAANDKEEPKPDMDKVAQLRKRNAGMAGSSGSGGDAADPTPTVAAKMTNAQFAKLKPEQKKRIFDQLRGA